MGPFAGHFLSKPTSVDLPSRTGPRHGGNSAAADGSSVGLAGVRG